MDKKITITAVSMRLLLGWFMFFDGLAIVMTPNWSASKFLLGAKTFPDFYAWFALPMNSWWIDPLNAWGITILGVALLLGVGIRFASYASALLMIIYYFPHYILPIVDHGYIVEEHIIYAAVFIFIAIFPPAQKFALSGFLRKTFLGRIPYLRAIL